MPRLRPARLRTALLPLLPPLPLPRRLPLPLSPSPLSALLLRPPLAPLLLALGPLGQAQLGGRAYPDALATAQAILTSTQRPDLLSAARFLRGQALRGLQRWDEAAADLRAVADANPLVAAAIRDELAELWLAAGDP